jgi:hypothetical protein
VKVGFLNNQMDDRGTGNATFNYAHYNEAYLGNESKIFTFPSEAHKEPVIEKFVNRFGAIYPPREEFLKDLDVLYHIKSGEDEGFRPPANVRYAVHAVFHPQPHGDRYAVISEWMGNRDNLPVVPHIVQLADTKFDYRKALEIPEDATVFGRHGGYDSFDIPWVWDSIFDVLRKRDDVYFIFLNTAANIASHPRVIHYGSTLHEPSKRAFINTCDAMIHARNRGETFGISVGEFAIEGKPVFTFDGSYERGHIYELKGTARTYSNEEDLTRQLLAFKHGERNHPFYDHYYPRAVMEQFKKVFLD